MNLIVYFPLPLLCPLSLPLFFLSPCMPPGSADEISGDGNMFSSLCVTNVQYATLTSICLMHISVIHFIQLLVFKSGLLWVLPDKYCTLQTVQLMLLAKLKLKKEKFISNTQGCGFGACVCNETCGMMQRRFRGL